MNYEQSFMKDYRRYSNIGSDYYRRGYQNVLNSLNASSPTLNTYLGSNMALGGSYGGSMVIANQQRQNALTRNRETASRSLLDMYLQGQRLALSSKDKAMQAYQYEDSKPSFLEDIAGFAAGGLLQSVIPGLGGLTSRGLSSLTKGGQSATQWQLSHGADDNTTLPVGYKNVPEYKPFDY